MEFEANSIEEASRKFHSYTLTKLLKIAGNGDDPEILHMLENGIEVEPEDPDWD